jgi:dihydroorotate dehydrogenase
MLKHYKFFRNFLFKFEAERAHYLAMFFLKLISPFIFKKKYTTVKVAGLNFPNRVGLAAGFDKNARWIKPLSKLGFGHIEIGTVTPIAQPGNEKPRLFRLVEDESIINRMGFNNDGSHKILKRLKKLKRSGIIIGGNIGKNKWTEPFLKIAPDLSHWQIDDILEVVEQTKIAGIVVSNTTVSRDGLISQSLEVGGLSGKPLKAKSLDIVKYIRQKNSKIAIIGVGGIFTSQDAKDYLDAGADLIQIWTGFIYQGPKLITDINSL